MMSRLVSLFVILALSVAAILASAHVARMRLDSAPQHAAHAGETMPSSGLAELACDGDQGCGAGDAGICAFACAGLSAWMTSPGAAAAQADGAARHGLPAATGHVGHTPGLNERPPIFRLL